MTHYQDFKSTAPEHIKHDPYTYGQTNSGGDIKGLLITLGIISLIVLAFALLFSGEPSQNNAALTEQSELGVTTTPAPIKPENTVD